MQPALSSRLLTADRSGAIAVVELHGEPAALQALLDARVRPGVAHAVGSLARGHWRSTAGELIDELLVVRRADDCCELHLHGGRGVVVAMRDSLRVAGVADATAPTTTATAFEHALMHARTPRLAKALLAQRHVWPVFRSRLAVALDHTDEHELRACLALAHDGAVLAAHADAGATPPTVVLVGEPNAGKSTLFNTLAGADRVIVSDTAGTTRDAIDTLIAIDGILVRLVDTAGFSPDAATRLATDRLERRAQIAALRALRRADLVLHLIDLTTSSSQAPPTRLAGLAAPIVRVGTKLDHAPVTGSRTNDNCTLPATQLDVSSHTGQHLDALRDAIRFALRLPPPAAIVPPIPLGADAAVVALRQRLRTALPASASVPELRSLASHILQLSSTGWNWNPTR
ncbi:MAG: GTPase [Planctomycetota bacterium]